MEKQDPPPPPVDYWRETIVLKIIGTTGLALGRPRNNKI